MKKLKLLIVELFLPFLLCWFLMTIFVDIFTVPTVFRNVSSLKEAGNVGMTVFSKFNFFEMIFSLFILMGAFYSPLHKKLYLVFSFPLFIWSQIYYYYMTPKISMLTLKIHQTAPNDANLVKLSTDHAYFHNLYRYLDSSKLLFLLVFIVIVVIHKIQSKERV